MKTGLRAAIGSIVLGCSLLSHAGAQTIPANVLYSTGTATSGTYASRFQTTTGSITPAGSAPYYIQNQSPAAAVSLYDPGASSAPSGTLTQAGLANPASSLFALTAGATLLISADYLGSASISGTQTYAGIGFINPNAASSTGQSGLISLVSTTNTGSFANQFIGKGESTSGVLAYTGTNAISTLGGNSTFTPPVSNTQWLRLQVSITTSANAVFTAGALAGTVTVTDSLYTISADGAASGTLVGSVSNTFSIASGVPTGSTASLDLTGGQIALFLQSYTASSAGASAVKFDNFAVSAVPDAPMSGLLLFGMAALAGGVARRRPAPARQPSPSLGK